MKVVLLLVCVAAVSFVAATEKVLFKDNKRCVCRLKTCDDDISCEESNCLCWLNNLKAHENDKSNKYPKSWVFAYRKLVEKRCRCLKKCEKRCTDDDIELCAERSWDRFICGWTDLAADILTNCKKGQSEKFLSDMGKISSNCIKKDCKPQCSGDSGCDPLLGSASVKCIRAAVEESKEGLDDRAEKHLIAEIGAVLIENAKDKEKCSGKHSCPIARNGCINEVNSKSATELAGLRGSTRAQLGHCTAHSLFYNLVQKITVCELKASSK